MTETAIDSLAAMLTGRKLGHYRVESLIGRGGMGAVFRARDLHLGRHVAVKVLAGDTLQRGTLFQRFIQEARLAAQLSHPNIVTIHEVNQDSEFVYIVMELLEGGSVQAALDQQGSMSWESAARTISSVCCGLEAAHARGLIHRDIKPANVFADKSGQVKLGDFGLARGSAASSQSLTTSGMVLGTPLFMSPEQCEGQPADRRSDIYSLGATFHALLTGSPPYTGEQPLQVAFAHCSAPLPNPRLADERIPERCAAIVQRAMAKKPGERYQSAGEMLAEVDSCLEPPASFAPAPPLPVQDRPAAQRPRWLRRQRHQAWLAIGTAIGLSLAAVIVLSLATGSATPPAKSATRSEPQIVAAPPPGVGHDGAASSGQSIAEQLAALFAEPGVDELQQAAARWKSIFYTSSDWRDEGGRFGRVRLVSHRIDGDRHYAVVRYPDGFASSESYPTIVFCSDDGEAFSFEHLRNLRACLPSLTECVVLVPSFRGQAVSMGGGARRFRSEGSPGSVVEQATDVMALLDLIAEHLSQADLSRIAVVGSGARAAVALQLGLRDPRVKAVIATEAGADVFQGDVQGAILQASVSREPPSSALARTVWEQIAEPLLAGALDLPAARTQLLSLSPARFAGELPPTHLYYGAFSTEYEMRQGQAFRKLYAQHGRWKEHFVCQHLTAGPAVPATLRTIQRCVRPLIQDLVAGRLPSSR